MCLIRMKYRMIIVIIMMAWVKYYHRILQTHHAHSHARTDARALSRTRTFPRTTVAVRCVGRRLGLISLYTQSLSNGCSRTASLYSRNSWYVLVPRWKKSWRRTVVMRWHARNALVHLPVMMSATPPKATMSSISTHDAFISVPMHPRNDISVCIIPGCNTSDVQQ